MFFDAPGTAGRKLRLMGEKPGRMHAYRTAKGKKRSFQVGGWCLARSAGVGVWCLAADRSMRVERAHCVWHRSSLCAAPVPLYSACSAAVQHLQ
jgi:hypothetical protein